MERRETMGENVPISTVQLAQAGGQTRNGVIARTANAITGILTAWFGPQNPIIPTAPEGTKGRTWQYTPGYNLLTGQRRPLEPLSFQDLRMLARNSDLVALAIETRKDQMETVDWEFRLKGQIKRGKDTPDPRIKILEDFFAYPDKDSGLSFKRWQRKLNDDLFITDWPCINKLNNRGGKPYAFRIIDGATIKPLVDDMGMLPVYPNPRYQQWLYGAAVGDFTVDEMLIMPRNPRPDKIFGFSPVEQIYVTINIAIRKQLVNLNKYTEGNIPEAMVPCPPEWTGEQIAQFQVYFDSLLTGNYGQQSKMRFMPNGLDKAVFPKNFDNADTYDNFLAKVICYAFSLPNSWLIEKVNRATAETTQDSAIAEGLMPFMQYWSDLMNYLVAWGWGWNDIECVPKMQKEIDVLKQAQAEDIRVKNGTLSVDEVREDLGESPIGQPCSVYVPSTGYVTIGRQGKDEAEEALANAPDPTQSPDKPIAPNAAAETPKDDEIHPPDLAMKLAKAGKKKLKMLPATGHQKAEKHLADTLTKFLRKQGRELAPKLAKEFSKADDEEIELLWESQISVFAPQLASVAKRGGLQALAQVDVTDEGITDLVSAEAQAFADARAAELVGMKWDETAQAYIDNPSAEWAITDSTRDMLNDTIAQGVKDQLSTDALAEQIQNSYAFSEARAQTIARTEIAYAHTQGTLMGWKNSGVVDGKEWLASDDACEECQANAEAGTIPIDGDFPSGDDGPPCHPNDECAILAVLKEEAEEE